MIATGTISAILQHKAPDLWSVTPNSSVYDAIVRMAERNVGALLVMDGDQLVGVVSERDYTRNVALKGKASKETAVRDIISTPVITATPAHSVEECMRLMTTNRVRHLPIMEANRVVGIVSIGDLVNWTISAQNLTINQLEKYITGEA